MERQYIRYQSSRLKAPCTFLYPADWKAREIAENGYVEVFIAGPRNSEDTYSTSFTVGVTGQADQTPLEAATALLSKFRSAFASQIVGPIAATVAGNSAVAVEITYDMPLPLNSIKPRLTPIRERNVFFRRGNQLYELDYAAPAEDYEAWLGAFRTLVESFAFQEQPAYRVAYRPAAVAVPQYVREGAPEYETAVGAALGGRPPGPDVGEESAHLEAEGGQHHDQPEHHQG